MAPPRVIATTIQCVRTRIAVSSLLALAAAASALTAGGAGAATHTTATVYEAFSYHGVIVPHVRVASGYCWTTSNVTRRDDAWRCFVGNVIYDPCFSSTFTTGVVVCPTPWNDQGTEIHLTKPLPARTGADVIPSLSLAPWAIQTASGANCTFASGATSVIHGKRLNYFCGASAKYGLWGFPNRSGQPWTILSAPFTAKVLSGRVAIRHAWM